MKYKLTYRLTFLDYWHISSGLSGGARLDSSVIKDDDGIAYVSGKTIKGLMREMAETLFDNNPFVKKTFGVEGVDMGEVYFTNATLDATTKEQIITNKLQNNLYDVIASTQIDSKKGIAVDNSLREIEVTIPIKLSGEIRDIESQEDFEKLKKSLQMIKRMGLYRNRGLGRCKFSEIKMKEEICKS